MGLCMWGGVGVVCMCVCVCMYVRVWEIHVCMDGSVGVGGWVYREKNSHSCS